MTVPTATVPPVGQLDSAAPPLAVSRTTAVVAEASTISTVGTSVSADAPVKVSVKPVAAAPEAVAVPAKPGIALIAARDVGVAVGECRRRR